MKDGDGSVALLLSLCLWHFCEVNQGRGRQQRAHLPFAQRTLCLQKSKGTWEAAKEATMEAERKGAEAHLKSCEAEHLLSQATELTQSAANARAKEAEVRGQAACVTRVCLGDSFFLQV